MKESQKPGLFYNIAKAYSNMGHAAQAIKYYENYLEAMPKKIPNANGKDYNRTMPSPLDPERLKIPAYLRKKGLFSQARQKLILTALDRKQAGLSYKSKRAIAPIKPDFEQTQPEPLADPVAETIPSPSAQNFSLPELLQSQSLDCIGTTTHYLEKINVAIIKLTAPLKEGETILIEGEDCLFFQLIEKMQIDREPVKKAKKGSHIGLKVEQEARVNGRIYRVPVETAKSRSRTTVERPARSRTSKVSRHQAEADFETPLI